MEEAPPIARETAALPDSTLDTLFKILSHSFRRYALICLREHRTMTLDRLATEVAVSAYGKPMDEIPEEDRERVFRSLYHTHVPMLVSANMVDYDQSEASVAIRDAAHQVDPFLSLVTSRRHAGP